MNDLLDVPWHNIFRAAAVLSARYRLLGLLDRVIAFKAGHGRLPASLAELKPGKRDFDPLNGKHLVYERLSNGFQLYSLGAKWTGVVSLTK